MGEKVCTLLDGRLHVYRRPGTRKWQCSIYLNGRNLRVSTGEEDQVRAMMAARDWALERMAEPPVAPDETTPLIAAPSTLACANRPRRAAPRSRGGATSFEYAAETFFREFQVITAGERNPDYVANKGRVIQLHLLPFFGKRAVREITAGLIQEYRMHRLAPTLKDDAGWANAPKPGRRAGRPSRSTLHKEIVTLRQILKTASRKGWIAGVPDMTAPYRASGKITHRAWFSPQDYERLVEAAKTRALHPKRERWRAACERMFDYIVFMGATGLRPDEASRLQFRDVEIVVDEATEEGILVIEVRGKRGVGYCKSMPGAVAAFERLQARLAPEPSELLFGKVQVDLFNQLLKELDLKTDRDGHVRTAYSLRHTYICLRLLDGADIYQLAKNCRTSVDMIETFYAAHIRTRVDASAINVRKAPLRRKAPSDAPAQANA